MKLWWSLLIVGTLLPMIISATNAAESELWEEDDKEILVRTVRGTKERAVSGSGTKGSGANSSSCRYTKGPWSDCDLKTNMRKRTLTFKKGDKDCLQTKVIERKCKACRYEKGKWSSCINQSMTRVDSLKPNSDPTCNKSRRVDRRCKPETNTKKATKDRSNKKSGKQQ